MANLYYLTKHIVKLEEYKFHLMMFLLLLAYQLLLLTIDTLYIYLANKAASISYDESNKIALACAYL